MEALTGANLAAATGLKAEDADVVAAALSAAPVVDEVAVQKATIDAHIQALSESAAHDSRLHEGADPLDADMEYCLVCSAIIKLRRQRAAL